MSVVMSVFLAILYACVIGCIIFGAAEMVGVMTRIVKHDTMNGEDIICLSASVLMFGLDIFVAVDRVFNINVFRSFIMIIHGKLQYFRDLDVTVILFAVLGIVFAVRGIWLILINFTSNVYCGDVHMQKAGANINFGGILLYLAMYTAEIYSF